jgi:uncharacterized protein (DUF697 family)
MSYDHQIAHVALQGYEHLELFGDAPRAHELTQIVKQHALLAVGAGMIPVPGADVAALFANTWAMYVRINKVVGVSFSENALKSIASGIFANLASFIPGIAIAGVAGALLKVIPGIGTVGGMAVTAAASVAMTYVMGKVYLKSLEVLVNSGKSLTEENIKQAAEQTSRDKAFVRKAYAEGKEVYANR